jgi:nicotinamide-nucleotide amidase
VIGRAREAGRTIATAESCTGGMIAAALTDIAGASAVFGHGFVSYANDAKVAMLGVEPGLIAREGAVSETVARAMAEGARARAGADLAVAVTGIAGPEGGSAEKPVGTVWFGLARKDGATLAERRVFPGGRDAVRRATVDHALDLLAAALG